MITRRVALLGAGGLAMAAAPDPGLAWQFSMPSIEEGVLNLGDFRGKVLLVVNTASFCGYTPQYTALESMHRRLGSRGFSVIGIPSQDFGQETDSNGAVKAFCELTYGVDFPMAGISHVRGKDAIPFYRWVRAQTKWEPQWNFFKVLIGRNGAILGTFSADDAPDGGVLGRAVEAAVGV